MKPYWLAVIVTVLSFPALYSSSDALIHGVATVGDGIVFGLAFMLIPSVWILSALIVLCEDYRRIARCAIEDLATYGAGE